jgi:catechol 2,3-dioxygenase-like lactoylglutathione lyase family enzyme
MTGCGVKTKRPSRQRWVGSPCVIDHVTIRVPDLEEGRRFYLRALELVGFSNPSSDGEDFVEWDDFSIAQATSERPPTRRLHIAFQAGSRQRVDEWWKTLTEAGYADDGASGPRPVYSPDYYGGFVIDPAGNSVEAIHSDSARHGGVIDHLWIRVRDLADSTRFFEAVAPTVAHQTRRIPSGGVKELPARTRVFGDGASFSVMEGDPTENLHLAFAAVDQEAVREFHRVGTAAGYRSLGEPGERPEYHPGYFAAYLADPDGNNVEAVFHDRAAV